MIQETEESTFTMRPKCIAVDFDETIAYYKRDYDSLFALLASDGISRTAARTAYEETRRHAGFSFDRFLNSLEEIAGPVSRETAREKFKTWLRDTIAPYPESIAAIAQWQNAGIPVAIVTIGEPEFQKYKIEFLGVPHDRLYVMPPSEGKTPALRALLMHYGAPIFFIDDNAAELDDVAEVKAFEDAVTMFHISRPNQKYPASGKFPHQKVNSLAEIPA